MVTIIFEAHSTTFDNEAHRSSGHNDVDLSELGLKQSQELGERYKNENFDAIFCSDLLRSYKTSEIALSKIEGLSYFEIITTPWEMATRGNWNEY